MQFAQENARTDIVGLFGRTARVRLGWLSPVLGDRAMSTVFKVDFAQRASVRHGIDETRETHHLKGAIFAYSRRVVVRPQSLSINYRPRRRSRARSFIHSSPDYGSCPAPFHRRLVLEHPKAYLTGCSSFLRRAVVRCALLCQRQCAALGSPVAVRWNADRGAP